MSNDDMTTAEVAAALHVTVRDVQSLCRSGELVCRKVRAKWSITRVSVEAYTSRATRKVKPE